MHVFEIVIFLLLIGAILAAISRKFGAPYPALLALTGISLALIPGVPTLKLDPELALALFVAPVLYDSAYDSSPRDLKYNLGPVSRLVIGAVIVTIIAVAFVVRTVIPEMTWPVAITLGAIVAPPDAAAATTVLKQLHLPHRLLVILEGESLFNDASALLIYRLAATAAMTGVVSGWGVIPAFLAVTIGSMGLAYVLSKILLSINARIQDVSTAIVVQFCGTFAVWIIAERLHLSGIITIVVFAMLAARSVPKILPSRIRIPSWATWDVAVFVFNILAFTLVGLQLKSILARATNQEEEQYAFVAAIICVTVIVTRLTWVFFSSAINYKSDSPEDSKNHFQNALVVGWCGMRGTVTLAAALALPDSFPYRDLILATALGVTVGTLILQGLTLKPLILHLELTDDGSVQREIQKARRESLEIAIETLKDFEPDEITDFVRRSYELQLRKEDIRTSIIKKTTQAQRAYLGKLRAKNIIGDKAFLEIEEEIDWAEQGWAQVLSEE
jgi:Na+/H+ antiporter